MHHDQTEGMGRCRGTWTFRLSAEWEPGSAFTGLWREKEGAGEYPLIELEIVKKLDVVLLSHAHEDHSVAIPLLYRLGYQGEVWTTRETREQLDTYFRAWRRNMERAGHALPYEEGDEQLIRYRFLEDEAEGGTWFELSLASWRSGGAVDTLQDRYGSGWKWKISGYFIPATTRRSPCFCRRIVQPMRSGR